MKEGRKMGKICSMKLASRSLFVLKNDICGLLVSVWLAAAPLEPVFRDTGKGEKERITA